MEQSVVVRRRTIKGNAVFVFVYWANEAKNPSFEANNFKLWVRSQSIIGVANVDLSKTYTLEILVDETKKTEELNNYLQFVNKFKLEEKNEKQRTY